MFFPVQRTRDLPAFLMVQIVEAIGMVVGGIAKSFVIAGIMLWAFVYPEDII